MFAYWLLFGVFAIGAIWFAASKTNAAATSPIPASGPPQQVGAAGSRALLIAAMLPMVMIGLRYDVGTDFGAYEDMFDLISRQELLAGITETDPAYGLLNWIAGAMGGGLWLVNIVCGILFMFGLVRFARQQPSPWLAVAVAVPYFIIAVAMGYSRQAVAIAFGMVGLVALPTSFARFVGWVLLGALFHRTAIILIPIVAIAYSRNRFQAVVIGLVGCAIGYFVLTRGQGLEHFERGYIARTRESSGAAIRLAMNFTPALIFLAWSRRFTTDEHERQLWRIFSWIGILSFGSYFLITSSTALDRMSLYIIPLQLFVFSRLPTVFGNAAQPSVLLVVVILAYSAGIEFVWLNFSTNAAHWLPYRMYLTG